MDGEYAPDIYRSCKAKVLLLDKERCFYPKRAVTRGDLMDAIYRGARSPKVKLPARSPFPDLSPKDERYPAYIWAYQNGLTSGWSDGKMHPDAVASRATIPRSSTVTLCLPPVVVLRGSVPPPRRI